MRNVFLVLFVFSPLIRIRNIDLDGRLDQADEGDQDREAQYGWKLILILERVNIMTSNSVPRRVASSFLISLKSMLVFLFCPIIKM